MSVPIESDLKEILTRFEQKFDKLDQKLDSINNKFEQKLDHLQKDVTDINLRLTKVETKLDAATEDIKEIKSTQKTVSTDVSDLKGLIIRTIPIN